MKGEVCLKYFNSNICILKSTIYYDTKNASTYLLHLSVFFLNFSMQEVVGFLLFIKVKFIICLF